MKSLRNRLDFLASLLYEAGITQWAVSPGSRNAPIVAGFIRHGGFELHSFPDERAAAFAAIGMGLAQQYPCGVICTSGTAAANFLPAVCEAFYQRSPLFVLTADRPAHLIDQWDGQTIHQVNMFQPYCRNSQSIATNTADEYQLTNAVYSLVESAIHPLPGPVHLNVELDDPIYQGLDESFHTEPIPKPFVFQHDTPNGITIEQVQKYIGSHSKILVLVGQNSPSESLSNILQNIENQFPVFTDICSHQIQHGLQGWDRALLNQTVPEHLHPDLIITMGMAFISKPLKQWIKKVNPVHIHVALTAEVGNPFNTNIQLLQHHEADFLQALSLAFNPADDYLAKWQQFVATHPIPRLEVQFHREYLWVKQILELATDQTLIHLGNSMSVRYASWAGTSPAAIYCNRGTSGIDGSLSTAVGHALALPHQPVWVILGDISAIYDAHALWTNAIPSNLKIFVLNNSGGRIFEWIDGPTREAGVLPFIQTPHSLPLESLAAFYGIQFTKVSVTDSAQETISHLDSSIAQLIEIRSTF